MYTLMQLPYSYGDLEPYIDAKTVETHYDKHHRGYLNKLNKIIEDNPQYNNLSLVELLQSVEKLPESIKQGVINNGGQVYNHNLYWESMQGGEQKLEISDALAEKLEVLGGYDEFKSKWSQAGATQFGSGWVWLVVDAQGNLNIEKTGNADSPIFHGKTPILTMDVWEHAYYLKYQNRRPEYIENFFNAINWSEVSRKYALAIS